MTAPVLMIAAPRSGSGKTTVTIGLLAAMRRRGQQVRSLKCGPDYIDAAYHAAATGHACANVDTWAMSPDHVAKLIGAGSAGADLLVIEAAMGLFDGAVGPRRSAGLSAARDSARSGAAAEIARRFGIPVVLVLDLAGMAQSAGALALGFARFDPGVEIAGVVLNGVASERHRQMAAAGLDAAGMPVLGWLPRRKALALPERHLGLVQAAEQDDIAASLSAFADQVEETVDLDAVAALARPARLGRSDSDAGTGPLAPPGQRIALAQDTAFTFMYSHLIANWREKGAEISVFSPLDDQAPPEDCDCCWLPGGYPELYAGQLSHADRFLTGLRRFADTRPVHGECGGFMVLGEGLVDSDGENHRMAGLMSHVTSFADRKLTLGYREARLRQGCALGSAGTVIRGHEFHYSTLTTDWPGSPLFDLADSEGNDLGAGGGRVGNVTGSYFHAIAVERD